MHAEIARGSVQVLSLQDLQPSFFFFCFSSCTRALVPATRNALCRFVHRVIWKRTVVRGVENFHGE